MTRARASCTTRQGPGRLAARQCSSVGCGSRPVRSRLLRRNRPCRHAPAKARREGLGRRRLPVAGSPGGWRLLLRGDISGPGSRRAEAADKLCGHRYDVVVFDRNVRAIPCDTLCRMIGEADRTVMVRFFHELTGHGRERTVWMDFPLTNDSMVPHSWGFEVFGRPAGRTRIGSGSLGRARVDEVDPVEVLRTPARFPRPYPRAGRRSVR